MKLFVGYSKTPEQSQSSARLIWQSHAMTNTGCEPATICIAAYRSSPRYALRHDNPQGEGSMPYSLVCEDEERHPLSIQRQCVTCAWLI